MKVTQTIKEMLDEMGHIPDIKDNHRILSDVYFDRGMDRKRADYYTKLLISGWNASSRKPAELFWAIEHGFLPEMLEIGITVENYRDWFPAEKYFRLHPLNNFFAFWVNDKITLKYVLQNDITLKDGRRINAMPRYFLYIENDGKYSYLMDSPKEIEKNENYLLNLLKSERELAIKPSNGAGGVGFVWLKYLNEGGKNITSSILWNNEPISETELETRLKDLKGYIVTEFIHQHTDLDKIYAGSSMTLRIIMVKNRVNKYSHPIITPIVSYARFGNKYSHNASNMSSGGIGVALDFETGRLSKYAHGYPRFYRNSEITQHPDSGFTFHNYLLPNWEIVKECVNEICHHLSSLEYLGFDIIITQDSCKLCEINTLPSLDFDQIFSGPLNLKKEAKSFFENKEKNIYESKNY